ncbi:MAG: hypothetical protein ACRECX_05330 [Methyloceanibacter sp.]|uniref:hypothetical protein n=1 Tax=Methyloceanibacter sp. TaxID=1965321 RepID=UPI003D6D5978
MLKKMLLVAGASFVLAGATMIAAPVPAEARHGCDARADVLYPHNKHARKGYKKSCKVDHRAWKKRNNKGIWIVL